MDRACQRSRENGDVQSWRVVCRAHRHVNVVDCCAQNDLEEIRRVHSAFLNEFPLLFGYWKRWVHLIALAALPALRYGRVQLFLVAALGWS